LRIPNFPLENTRLTPFLFYILFLRLGREQIGVPRFYEKEASMTLAGKKIAVLAENNYQELELWYPLLRLREEGAEVRLVGPQGKETYQSKHGYPATSDLGIEEVKAGEWDAIIVPGGYAPDLMRRNAAMVKLVRES
jgi:hypothetical protein